MRQQILHTPEGVRDIYGIECRRKLMLEEKLQEILHLYGYQDIQTPMFEFFDVFGKEIGTISSKELYKFLMFAWPSPDQYNQITAVGEDDFLSLHLLPDFLL